MSFCARSALSFKSLSSFHRAPPAGRLLSMARNHAKDCGGANDWYSDHVTGFARCLEIVAAAGGWKPYVRAPRVSLVVLRRLCEKERARPPPELARLFALDKFIFWRMLSFWRSEREMPVCLMNTDVPAPPPPEHQFLPEEKFLPPPPKE